MENESLKYEELVLILKGGVHLLHDKIEIEEVLVYLKDHISQYNCQQIKAQVTQYGNAAASHYLFNAIRSDPRKFPLFMAALKESKQHHVYRTLKKVIRDKFKNNPQRLLEIETLIETEENKLQASGYEHGEDNEQEGAYGGSAQALVTVYSRSDIEAGALTSAPPTTPSLSALDNEQEALVTVYSRSDKEARALTSAPPTTPSLSALDNEQEEMGIYNMNAAVLEELEKELATMSDQDPNCPKWKWLCRKSACLGISRQEVIAIGKDTNPGEKFTELLHEHDVKVAQLEMSLNVNKMKVAIKILRRDSNYQAEAKDKTQQVVRRNAGWSVGELAADHVGATERNALSLNLDQRDKFDTGSKYKSLPLDCGAASGGSLYMQPLQSEEERILPGAAIGGSLYMQPLQSEEERILPDEMNRCHLERNVPHENRNISLNNAPDLSIGSFTDETTGSGTNFSQENQEIERRNYNLANPSIGSVTDETTVKGTQVYQAVSDRENEFTQKNPEMEMHKLASDRVKQTPTDQNTGNLSSFQDIGKKQKTTETEDDQNVQGEREFSKFSSTFENPNLVERAARTEKPGFGERNIPHLVHRNIPVVEQHNEFCNIHETDDTEEKKRLLPLAEPDSDTATVVPREEVGSMEQESLDSRHTDESEDGGSTSYSKNQSVAESAGSLDETIGVLETITLENTGTQDEEDKTEGSV